MANEKARNFFRALGGHLKGGAARFSAACCGTAVLFGCGVYELFRPDGYGLDSLFGFSGNLSATFADVLARGVLWGIAAALLAQLACERRCQSTVGRGTNCRGADGRGADDQSQSADDPRSGAAPGADVPGAGRQKSRWLPWAAGALATAAASAAWYPSLLGGALQTARPVLWWTMTYAGVLIAALCAAVWLLYTPENQDMLFGYLVKSAFFCLAVALVLVLGLELCLAAADALLLSVSWRAYSFAAMLVGILLLPNLYFSYLPRTGDTLSVPRAYTVLVGYAALPVYLMLLAVLYGYLVKILVTRHLPAGTMNWYASFALAVWVFFWLGLRMHPNALIQKFLRWGWALQLPVLAAQLVCIAIRLSAYGLTSLRYLSLVCIGLGVLALILSALRRGPRCWFAAAAAAALVVTLTPLNPLDVSLFSQTRRLAAVLTADGMWDGTAILPAESAPADADREIIESSFDYIQYNDPVFYNSALFSQVLSANSGEGDPFTRIFGFSAESGSGDYTDSHWYWMQAAEGGIPIDGYRTLYEVHDSVDPDTNGSDLRTSLHAGEDSISVSYADYAARLLRAYPEGNSRLSDADACLSLENGCLLYVSDASITVTDGKIVSFSVDGYLLVP